jgi:hypothetical protein
LCPAGPFAAWISFSPMNRASPQLLRSKSLLIVITVIIGKAGRAE